MKTLIRTDILQHKKALNIRIISETDMCKKLLGE